MEFYVFILIILFIIWFLSKCKGVDKNIVFWSGIFILILIASLKSLTVGTDSIPYYWIFNTVDKDSNDVNGIYHGTQIGWMYYVLFFKTFANYDIWLFINYLIAFVCIGFYIKRLSPDAVLSLIIFYLFFFSQSMNIMRQTIALGIISVGLVFLQKKEYYPFLISCGIASLFHFSAVLVLFFILLPRLPIRRIAVPLVVISFYIGFFSNILQQYVPFLLIFEDLNENVAGYIDRFGNGESRNLFSNSIINIVFIVSFILSKNKESIFVKLWFLFVVFSNILGFFGQANRIFLYFLFGMIIAVPEVYKSLKCKPIQYIYLTFYFIYAIGYWYMSLSQNIGEVIPYKLR